MRLHPFLLLLFGLFCFFANAQLETAIWYFGRNAGLDFRSGNPVPIFDGQVFTIEGSSVISDPAGNLLFYSDGITVWNRNHDQMPNGDDLQGNPSATNSGIIVPAPGSANLYYIFSAGAIAENLGIHYSVVDLNLDGGLGDVTVKNVPLLIPASEKLTAVQHANGIDTWVVARDTGNSYYAYLVTAAGVQNVPVISSLGFDISMFGPFHGSKAGDLKFSPDGTKAAAAYWFPMTDMYPSAEWYDFNPATGVFTNARNLFTTALIDTEIYGVEFSPSGRFIYATEFGGSIFQFDTQNPTAEPLELYAQDPSTLTEFGALQIGLDGKIYVANYFGTALSVINNPNEQGLACNFQHNALDLGGPISQLGLPPFIQSFFFVGDIQAKNFCLGDTTEFSIDVSEPITSILWDFGDGNTSNLESPTHIYAASGQYTVSVVVTTASETTTETDQILISEIPVANSPGTLEFCENETLLPYEFDLNSQNNIILGTQDPATFLVGYFPTQQDADDLTNELIGVQALSYGTSTFFVRVSNRANAICYDTASFDVLIKQQPIPSAIPDITVCDDDADGLYTFDLNTFRTGLLANETPIFSEVSFHLSQNDADLNTNPLADTYINTQLVETIYFRMQNNIHPECYETGEIRLEVIGQVIANTPTDLEYCDDNNDGQAVFDLTQTEAEIIGTQNASSINITFHESQADADGNTNALSASNYLSDSYQNTIYVRVENASDNSCYDTTSFNLNIFDTPIAPSVTNWLVCDDNNDGIYAFDFTEKIIEILNGASGVSVSYFESQADADVSQNAIIGNYQNSSNPQTIYFRLENSNNIDCYDVGSFEIQVYDTPTAYTPTDIIVCDDDETGRYSFDLSQKDVEVLNGQDGLAYEVSYHTTELEALNNENPLSKTNYQNSNLNEIVWARIQHSQLEYCYDVSSFNLIVNPLPQLNLEETYVICPDSPDLVIEGGSFETYEWRNADGIIVGNNPSLAITELGPYSLTVSQTTNGVVCENSTEFEVLSSGAPESFTVNTSGISDVITLTIDAIGIGEFEYSVDGENYQTSNSFEVFPGQYTIYVRDPLECRILTQDIIALGYQKFFTPNNDGNNDYWNIIGGDMYPDSKVYVYDRYGKLLKQLDINSSGWDGTYLGADVPSSDYWFKYEYDNGKIFTGHFALKR